MPRINPWDSKYSRPAVRQETREFSDPKLGKEKLKVTLQAIDEFNLGLVLDKRDELVRKYVTGADGEEPLALAAPDGKRVRFSRYLCAQLAGVMVCQVPEADEEPADLLWWIGIVTKFPAAWRALQKFHGEISQEHPAEGETDGDGPDGDGEGGEGNPSGAATGR